MQTILQILEKAGGFRPSLYLVIENPPYMELVIGATDESGPLGFPAISIAHYGKQNGDAMRDPEMCFELSKPDGKLILDLLFVVERLALLLDENRLAIVARHHGIKKVKDSDTIAKLFGAYLRRGEESQLGSLLVEITILHAVMRQNGTQVLRDAAAAYKVDVDAIGLKVKQEFAAKAKGKLEKKPTKKAVPQKTKKAA